MASITYSQTQYHGQTNRLESSDSFELKRLPRRCMVVSWGLVITGLVIPTLMIGAILPASLILGIASLGLIATGGIMALIFCGEI